MSRENEIAIFETEEYAVKSTISVDIWCGKIYNKNTYTHR